jgi:hypothetical protein
MPVGACWSISVYSAQAIRRRAYTTPAHSTIVTARRARTAAFAVPRQQQITCQPCAGPQPLGSRSIVRVPRS